MSGQGLVEVEENMQPNRELGGTYVNGSGVKHSYMAMNIRVVIEAKR